MSEAGGIHIRSFVAPGFAENGYVMWRDGAAEAVVIDPGDAAPVLELLGTLGLAARAVLLTHAHIDHVQGVPEVVRQTGAPVLLHPADRILYDNAPLQAAQFGMRIDTLPAHTEPLEHGQVLDLAGIMLHVRHSPGHAPGHVMFTVPEAGCGFAGDVVFLGSIGRTDLPGGDHAQLMRSIREQVLTLPDDTVLHTGHGPSTTVGHERISNPFLVPQYGGGLA